MAAEEPDAEVPQEVLDYLGDQKTLTLATATAGGVPRAATMLYVSKGPVLYIWARPQSTTAQHLEQNPLVSFTIGGYSEDWAQTKGIQGNGECEVVLSGEEIARVALLFGQKFPTMESGSSTTGISFFRIRPREMQFIDNAKGGGELSSSEFGPSYHRDRVLSVFSDLPREDAVVVTAQLQTLRVDEGEVVVRQGGPADKFFIVIEGELEVSEEGQAGESRKLATLGPGQFFGEVAIMRDTPRAATVTAVRASTLMAMERDTFRGVVADSLGTTRDFERVIQGRLERLEA